MTAKRKGKKKIKSLGVAPNGYVYSHLIELREDNKEYCPCGEEMVSHQGSGVKCKNGHWFCF